MYYNYIYIYNYNLVAIEDREKLYRIVLHWKLNSDIVWCEVHRCDFKLHSFFKCNCMIFFFSLHELIPRVIPSKKMLEYNCEELNYFLRYLPLSSILTIFKRSTIAFQTFSFSIHFVGAIGLIFLNTIMWFCFARIDSFCYSE